MARRIDVGDPGEPGRGMGKVAAVLIGILLAVLLVWLLFSVLSGDDDQRDVDVRTTTEQVEEDASEGGGGEQTEEPTPQDETEEPAPQDETEDAPAEEEGGEGGGPVEDATDGVDPTA